MMIMKKQILFLVTVMLPMLASAYDIEVKNADGVTIYYNYINDGTELEVTKGGYSNVVNIPSEVTYMNRTRKVTRIGHQAFINCIGLTSITIPKSVTTIGSWVFYGCTRLTSITIPNSITSIGESAFEGCSGLNKVIVPDIAAWCSIDFEVGANPLSYARHLFSDENTEIKDLIIPNSVTSIAGGAFQYCSSLNSVTFGDNVTTIGVAAFRACSGLTTITIPNSVKTIGGSAFKDCI